MAKRQSNRSCGCLSDFGVNEQLRNSFDDLGNVHRQHGASMEDYRRIFAELDGVRDSVTTDLLRERSYLKSVLNRNEWAAIFMRRQERLEQY